MKKKVLAFALALVLLLSMMAGCSKPAMNQEQQAEPSGEQSTEKQVTEDGKNSEEKPEEKPEEIVKVTWVIRSAPQEDDEKVVAAVNEILREKYALELNLIAIPNAEYNDRMNLMITSGEEWDLCYTASFTNNFYNNVTREAFLGLDDLLANTEAGQKLMSVYPDGLLGIATVNGSVYAVPNYQLIYNQTGAYIQKDLAEEFGLDVDSVKTIQDLEPFMEWVRDNKEGIWPICEGASFPDAADSVIYDRFNQIGGSQAMGGVVELGDDTYTVVDQTQQEDYYESRKLLNSYFHRGFIRSDVATVVDNSADLTANRYAIYITTSKPGGDSEMSQKYGKDYILVNIGPAYLPYNAGATTMTAININSKQPEAAMKLLSVMWTDTEVFNTMLFGLENEHYKKVGENRVEMIPDSGYDRSSFGWALGNQFNAWLLPGQADDVWEVTEANNKSATRSLLMGFVPDFENVATEIAQISSVVSEYDNGWKYADDFDAWYNEFIEKKNIAGQEAVIAEVQSQINAWREANGK